ncbi:MAG: nuclear transport factor 2 family protein [Sphingomonadales bacterium]|nr:nuclear transport factor 2 family protein [Sphingomonadales bacterium]
MEAGQSENYTMTVKYGDSPVTNERAESNRQTLKNAFENLLRGNVEAFWSVFHPEVIFYEASCLPYGGAHEGLPAARAAQAKIEQVFDRIHAVFEALLAAEDIVVMYQTITVRVRDNGNCGTLPVSELFRFRDGKVVEWRALYADACMVANLIKGD